MTLSLNASMLSPISVFMNNHISLGTRNENSENV